MARFVRGNTPKSAYDVRRISRTAVSTESTPQAAEPLPENLVEAGAYPNATEGFEHGLVVLAMGRPYWLVPAAESHRLLVEPQRLEEVQRQLACYDRESVGWPPAPIRDPSADNRIEFFTPLLWAIAMLVVEAAHPHWIEAGAVDRDAIVHRYEVWRVATALALHGDVGHLVSNVFNGILVFSATVSTLGRRRGWTLIAVAGIVDNLASVALHAADPYRSLGASTAVFGAVGLLTGRALRLVAAATHPHRWRALFVPAVAGSTVLALYGAGGVHVDIVAHFTGFVAGTLLGLIFGGPRPAAISPPAVSE